MKKIAKSRPYQESGDIYFNESTLSLWTHNYWTGELVQLDSIPNWNNYIIICHEIIDDLFRE